MLERTGAAADKPLRVVVMVSGGGTNLQAIIDSVKDGYDHEHTDRGSDQQQ